MYYIYCFTNLINNKKYIGQTSNPQKRRNEHIQSSKCSSRKDYNDLFHQKIREYGIENFNFEILEELDTEDLDYVDAREIYWIQAKNSYVKNNQGYNVTLGGQGAARRKPSLTEEEVEEIIDLLKNSNVSQYKIAEQFNISTAVICRINTGKSCYHKNYDYPIRKNFIDDDIKFQIKELLVNSSLSCQKIADLKGVSLSTVKRIKASLKNK